MEDEEIKEKLRLFLIFLDRTITDSFCHANLGSKPTRAGRRILELEKDLKNAVPNFTLKYNPEKTTDGYAQLAIYPSLFCANPAICSDVLNMGVYPYFLNVLLPDCPEALLRLWSLS